MVKTIIWQISSNVRTDYHSSSWACVTTKWFLLNTVRCRVTFGSGWDKLTLSPALPTASIYMTTVWHFFNVWDRRKARYSSLCSYINAVTWCWIQHLQCVLNSKINTESIDRNESPTVLLEEYLNKFLLRPYMALCTRRQWDIRRSITERQRGF